MKNWNTYAARLEIIEELAAYNDWMCSEEQLSERFDEEIAQFIAEYTPEDHTAIRVAFNNWTDRLCKDGEIHPEQYRQYCYVGKYS